MQRRALRILARCTYYGQMYPLAQSWRYQLIVSLDCHLQDSRSFRVCPDIERDLSHGSVLRQGFRFLESLNRDFLFSFSCQSRISNFDLYDLSDYVRGSNQVDISQTVTFGRNRIAKRVIKRAQVVLTKEQQKLERRQNLRIRLRASPPPNDENSIQELSSNPDPIAGRLRSRGGLLPPGYPTTPQARVRLRTENNQDTSQSSSDTDQHPEVLVPEMFTGDAEPNEYLRWREGPPRKHDDSES